MMVDVGVCAWSPMQTCWHIRAVVQPQALGVEASTHAYFLYLSLLELLWSGIWSHFVPGISTSGTRFSATSNSQSETRIPSTFGRLYVRGLSRGK